MSESVPLREHVPCPLCDSTSSSILFTPWVEENDPEVLYGAASGVPGTQVIVICNQCSMIYESPRFSEEVIVRAYEESEEGEHDSQYPMRVESFYGSLKSLSAKLPGPGSKVLDIGTAGGAFLDAAERFGFDAYGLEPSQYLVESGRRRGFKVLQGTIDNHPFDSQSFDLVCLWDVIEHLANPKLALTEARNLLNPDGLLLINYPDIGTLQAKMAGKRFWWILSVHLSHFDRESITRLCRMTGFETFYFQRYWQKLELGYLMHMATVYKVPLSATLLRVIPSYLRRLAVPYYASQTTTLARLS